VRQRKLHHISLLVQRMAGFSDPPYPEHTREHTRSGALSCAVLRGMLATSVGLSAALAGLLCSGAGYDERIRTGTY
jgi:hypothetical protein